MPGANLGIDLVPLQSSGPTFAILCRFPAGFERPGPGGYQVSEDFLVLDGLLQLEGITIERGTVCSVPAGYVRTMMRTSGGCTVLAWFGGPPDYRSADELSGQPGQGLRAVRVLHDVTARPLLRAAQATWRIVDAAMLTPLERPVDIVDLELRTWYLVGPGGPPPVIAGPLLVRATEVAVAKS